MAIADPTDITGCVLWLDTSTITATDGDPIGTWTDQSGSGNDATASGADRPVYRDGTDYYHAQPTLEFNDVGHRLLVATSASLANGQVTYNVICRLTDLGANTDPQWLFNKVNANPATVGLRVCDSDVGNAGRYEAFYRLSASAGTARTVVDAEGPYRGAWTILTFRYNGTTGQLYVDGLLAGATAVSGAIQTSSNGALHIGNHSSVDNAFLGQIGDVVVYNNAISDGDLADLVEWYKAKYPNSEYVKASSILSGGIRHVRIRSANDTGLSDNQMLVVTTSGAINHYTSPTSDPHNWTLANSGVIATDASYRTLDFIVVSGTWYVYVDRATSNGSIELFTGSSVTSLTEHGSSPVISGSVGDYPRTPGVIHESGAWTMLIDVRTDSVAGSVGYVDRWTSSDGISWTKDAVNSPVISPTGTSFEASDIVHPMIYKKGPSDYLVVYAGYNEDHPLHASYFPHEIGLLESTDLITFTRSNKNPALTHDHAPSNFDQVFVANPCLFYDGSALTLYYSAANEGGTIQPGYAVGLPVSTTIDVYQTMLSDSVSLPAEITYIIAANRLFFFGAYGEEGQDVQHNYFTLSVSNAFDFGGGSGYNQELDLLQYLGFTDRYFAPDLSNFLDLSATVRRAYAESVSNTFSWNDHGDSPAEALKQAYIVINEFSFTITVSASSQQDIYQYIELEDSVDSSATEFGRPSTHSVIKQHVSFSVTGSNCPEKSYTPFIGSSGDDSFPAVSATPPTLGSGVLTLTYPRVSPTTTLVLKNPAFGNTDAIRFTKIDRKTRGGDRKIYSDLDWTKTQTLELTVENLCNASVTIDELVTFLNESLGKLIGLLDWENRQWEGIIVVPETEIVPTVSGHKIRITFEGVLA